MSNKHHADIRWEITTWSLIVICYTLLAVISAARSLLQLDAPDYSTIVSVSFIDWYAWMLLTPFVMWLIHDYGATKRSSFHVVFFIFILALFITILYLFLVHLLLVVNPYVPPRTFLDTVFDHYYFLATSLFIIGVVYAFNYYSTLRTKEVALSHLHADLAKARLQLLTSQIRPHFIFNSLNAISTLLRRDPDAADRGIMHLGQLLRNSLDSSGEHVVEFRKELDLLRSYIAIEQMRFGSRLTFNEHIDNNVFSASIPILLLQPLIENSITHGMKTHRTPVVITLSAHSDGSSLVVTIEDNGRGLSPTNVHGIVERVGLSNTRERLENLYPSQHTLRLEDRPTGGLVVTISIPFRIIEAADKDSKRVVRTGNSHD